MADTNLGSGTGTGGYMGINPPSGGPYPTKPGDNTRLGPALRKRRKLRPIDGNLQPLPEKGVPVPGRISIPKDPGGRILPPKPGGPSKPGLPGMIDLIGPPPVLKKPGEKVLHKGRRYMFQPQRGKINRFNPYQSHSTTAEELRQAAMSRLREE